MHLGFIYSLFQPFAMCSLKLGILRVIKPRLLSIYITSISMARCLNDFEWIILLFIIFIIIFVLIFLVICIIYIIF